MPQARMDELYLIGVGPEFYILDPNNDGRRDALDERTVQATFISDKSQLISIVSVSGGSRKDDG